MIATKKISITRAEGRTSECGIVEFFTGPEAWGKATSALFMMSISAPKDGGYHKVDFAIVWEDGEEYVGRVDLKHHTVESPNLATHVRDFCEIHSGRWCPPWMGRERYDRYLATIVRETTRVSCGNLLDNYQIGSAA